jgi:hypothetical protein
VPVPQRSAVISAKSFDRERAAGPDRHEEGGCGIVGAGWALVGTGLHSEVFTSHSLLYYTYLQLIDIR